MIEPVSGLAAPPRLRNQERGREQGRFLSAKNSLLPSSHSEESSTEESPLVELVQIRTADAKSRLSKAITLLLNAGKPSSIDTDIDAKDGGEVSER